MGRRWDRLWVYFTIIRAPNGHPAPVGVLLWAMALFQLFVRGLLTTDNSFSYSLEFLHL